MYARTDQDKMGTIEGYIDTEIATVRGDATIKEVLNTMTASNASVVMVAEGEDIVGLLTAGDMGVMVVRGIDLETSRARDFSSLCGMSGSRPCVNVNYDEEPLNVLKVMQSWSTERVLVIKEEKVVGTISALGALKGWMERV